MLKKLNKIGNLSLLLVVNLLCLVVDLYVLMRGVELRSRVIKGPKELVQGGQVVFTLNDSSEIEVFIEEKFNPVLLHVMASCSRN